MRKCLIFRVSSPGGKDIEEARQLLASALVDMAETNLLHGEPLPQPNPTCTDPEADLEEPIYSSDQWVQG